MGLGGGGGGAEWGGMGDGRRRIPGMSKGTGGTGQGTSGGMDTRID